MWDIRILNVQVGISWGFQLNFFRIPRMKVFKIYWKLNLFIWFILTLFYVINFISNAQESLKWLVLSSLSFKHTLLGKKHFIDEIELQKWLNFHRAETDSRAQLQCHFENIIAIYQAYKNFLGFRILQRITNGSNRTPNKKQEWIFLLLHKVGMKKWWCDCCCCFVLLILCISCNISPNLKETLFPKAYRLSRLECVNYIEMAK